MVLAVDHDDEALETHGTQHPGLSVNWDLSDVVEQAAEIVRRSGISLVGGGPPRQPSSRPGWSRVRS